MNISNPLRQGTRINVGPEPCVMVIFGGSGDLTRRKLIPSLYRLYRQRRIPAGFSIVGMARSPWDDGQYRNILHSWIDKVYQGTSSGTETWNAFAEGIHYIRGNYHKSDIYRELKEFLTQTDATRSTRGNRIFYLATSAGDYEDIIQHLGTAGLNRDHTEGSGWVRIIIEKPFGRDLATARELNRNISSVFREEQVYRIDHYLGKETVQNILVFRFANGIFEPVWNHQFIDSVQIAAGENIGIGSRGAYYEETGALRDMVQNHMMQLLSLVAMEPPPDFSPDSVRSEKAKVLHSIRPFTTEDVHRYSVRGQYSRGYIGGKEVSGYLEEEGVSPGSRTETFAAIRFNIDNWRWANVPFYIRTGKNLPKRVTEISVIFQRTPHFIFRRAPSTQVEANTLAIRIQPDEGITLKFIAKLPGQAMEMRPVNMDFRYGSTFGSHLADAYERLLLDTMLGDPTLFDRIDSVEAAWTLMQPFLDVWGADQTSPLPQYLSGVWGPREAEELLARDNRSWRLL